MRIVLGSLLEGPALSRVVLGGGVLAATGLALALVGVLRRHSFARSGGLMVALTGFFVVFSDLMWSDGRTSPATAAGLLVASVLVFRLMSAFEPAALPPGPEGLKRGARKP